MEPQSVSDTLKKRTKPVIKSDTHKVTKASKTQKTRFTIVQTWPSHCSASQTKKVIDTVLLRDVDLTNVFQFPMCNMGIKLSNFRVFM